MFLRYKIIFYGLNGRQKHIQIKNNHFISIGRKFSGWLNYFFNYFYFWLFVKSYGMFEF